MLGGPRLHVMEPRHSGIGNREHLGILASECGIRTGNRHRSLPEAIRKTFAQACKYRRRLVDLNRLVHHLFRFRLAVHIMVNGHQRIRIHLALGNALCSCSAFLGARFPDRGIDTHERLFSKSLRLRCSLSHLVKRLESLCTPLFAIGEQILDDTRAGIRGIRHRAHLRTKGRASGKRFIRHLLKMLAINVCRILRRHLTAIDFFEFAGIDNLFHLFPVIGIDGLAERFLGKTTLRQNCRTNQTCYKKILHLNLF